MKILENHNFWYGGCILFFALLAIYTHVCSHMPTWQKKLYDRVAFDPYCGINISLDQKAIE